MLLGKRPRPPMKRTTSMKDVAVDLGAATAPPVPSEPEIPGVGDGDWKMDRRPDPTTVPPRGPRRSSADYTSAIEAAPFLRACALCNRHLRSGRDIFMYRGEIAFCSSECREQQIKLDEWKEKVKCSASSVKGPAQAKPKANVTTSDASSNGETMAAA